MLMFIVMLHECENGHDKELEIEMDMDIDIKQF
jgi:hypothetical protein